MQAIADPCEFTCGVTEARNCLMASLEEGQRFCRTRSNVAKLLGPGSLGAIGKPKSVLILVSVCVLIEFCHHLKFLQIWDW